MLVATYLIHMHEYVTDPTHGALARRAPSTRCTAHLVGRVAHRYVGAGSWLLVNIIGHSAAYLRLGLRISKYAIWAGLAVALHYSREHVTLPVGVDDAPFPLAHASAFAASVCAVFAVGARKTNEGKPNAISRALDAAAVAALASTIYQVGTQLTQTPPPPPPPPRFKVF